MYSSVLYRPSHMLAASVVVVLLIAMALSENEKA
jgi:hypothetical protein